MKPKVIAKVRALLVELEPVCRLFDAVRMMMDALPVCRKHERRMAALRSLEKRTARISDRIEALRKRAGVAR